MIWPWNVWAWRASEALALEDSPTGLASAHGGGIEVVAVGHRRTEGELAVGGHRYLADLADTERAMKARWDSRRGRAGAGRLPKCQGS